MGHDRMVRRQRRAMQSKVIAWAEENGPKMRDDVAARVKADRRFGVLQLLAVALATAAGGVLAWLVLQ